ncbi:MAG: helix-turn-helix transcriptional regulator [Clostridia bacterium]|nr:helix-turn-helix transcriptional regulator [Clostridia bacterium]
MNWKESIDENVRLGIVELLILHMLLERDMYGYEIREELAVRTNNAFLVKEGSLYGPLYRMQSRGIITSRKEMVVNKRFRMYYMLTDHGREYLEYGKEQMKLVFAGVESLLNWKGADNEQNREEDN